MNFNITKFSQIVFCSTSILMFFSILETNNIAANANEARLKTDLATLVSNRNNSGLIGDWEIEDIDSKCRFRTNRMEVSLENLANTKNPCKGEWNYVEGNLYFTYLDRLSVFAVEWIDDNAISLKPVQSSNFEDEIILNRQDNSGYSFEIDPEIQRQETQRVLEEAGVIKNNWELQEEFEDIREQHQESIEAFEEERWRINQQDLMRSLNPRQIPNPSNNFSPTDQPTQDYDLNPNSFPY